MTVKTLRVFYVSLTYIFFLREPVTCRNLTKLRLHGMMCSKNQGLSKDSTINITYSFLLKINDRFSYYNFSHLLITETSDTREMLAEMSAEDNASFGLSKMKINQENRRELLKSTSRSVRFSLKNTHHTTFDIKKPTEELHKSDDKCFYGNYAHIRKTLDYSYHKNYTEHRQRLQNSIIDDMLESALITDVNGDVCTTPTEPWLVFTAGAMGAGKGYTIKTLVQEEKFPLIAFVSVDPDDIRRLFPEYDMFVKTNPLLAGEFTRKEAGLCSEILTLAALQAGKNVLVDGSLRDSDWYQKYFKNLRDEFPSLKIGIIHVTAPREAVLQRAEQRGKLTGRVIPHKLLEEAIIQVPRSVKILSPLADYFCELSNAPDSDIKLVTEGETWEKFQAQWLQTCAWVPGRRKQIIKKMKSSFSPPSSPTLTPQNSNEAIERIPRRASFCLAEKKDASVKAMNVCPPKRDAMFQSFRVSQSTEDNYRSFDNKFYGSFVHIRKTLDYTYHSNYSKKRQWLQDSVIEDMLETDISTDVNGDVGDTPSRPWIIFTAGAKGAGKRWTMNHLIDTGKMPLVGFIPIDPDEIRSHLPETFLYLFETNESADDFTRKEVRYLTELLTLAGLYSGKNVILDGALRDTEWYKMFIARIRDEFNQYRIGILHISAPRELIYKRVELRELETGKSFSREKLDASLRDIPKACEMLKPYVDYFCEFQNSEGDPEIQTEGITWESFRQNWLQVVAWKKNKENKKHFFIPSR